MAYRRDRAGVSTFRAFIRFPTQLPPRVDEVVVFARIAPQPGRGPYALPDGPVRVVELPYYPRVTDVPRMLRAIAGSCRRFARELDDLDAVWIFGPHPVAFVLALIARRRGVPLFLGVRQDYGQYIAHRLPGPRWRWAVPVARMLDLAFRRLARRAPTVAVGAELARRYATGRAPVLMTGFSLVGRADLVSLDEALRRSRDGEPRHLLTVSRLDPEKNPLLLLDVIAALRGEDARWRLTIAGDGPLRDEVTARAAALGLADVVTLAGEVTNGPALWELYRAADVFLHVSLTEGLPQVLFEAQAAGLPVVATAVGGVPEAIADGRTGLLIGPGDAAAAVAAVRRVSDDPALRERLITNALQEVAQHTTEAQLDRLAAFFRTYVESYGRR
ncbi:MAG TPA: glycosyltransferase [Solirubrobacteraceae bacterium]|nr:glycosyltransferase [Solirubrobacteraceae bacterium]